MDTTPVQRDGMFRQFQIQKFARRLIVPAVTMTMNVDATRLIETRHKVNRQIAGTPRITVTHLVMKAVANVLVAYPILYSFFNGSRIIDNPELVLNIPVDIENHVDYLAIRQPDSRSLIDIANECERGLGKINRNDGEFFACLRQIQAVPSWKRRIARWMPGKTIDFLREHYGNFVISNFGSFNVSHGSLVISQPLIASLCMGRISQTVTMAGNGDVRAGMNLPLSIVFDHRAVDGGYVGRFLGAVKELLEAPEEFIDS
jgi:pyruvate dehydrogenase E2 component (dihydrolipoamide acetyltransferase)